MMRRALALVALAVLVVPLVHAAASGARGPISADNPVSDVAIARDAGRFAAATSDPGSTLSGAPNAVSWRLWSLDGSDRTSGGIDPAGCPNSPGTFENCQTRATRIAVNPAGTRIAVAGQTGEGSTPGTAILGLFTDSGANLFTDDRASSTVNALDLSNDGGRVVAGGAVMATSASNPSGFLSSISSAGQVADVTLDAPVVALAMNGAGTRLVAGAGHHVRANPNDLPNTLSENERTDGTSVVQGTVRSVDISDHAKAWSVAGYDSGYFALFSDNQGGLTPAAASVQEYQKREAGDTSAIDGVAIRPNATAFATGSAGGRIRLYAMDPGIDPQAAGFQPTLAATLDNAGAVVDLAFSGDGRYLAARAGGGIRFYDTQGNTLTELWRDDRTGMPNTVAIDGRGEHVVAAAGSSVIVYDAIHRLAPTFPSATQTPGATVTHALTFRNDGNRVDKVDLIAEPPAGAGVQFTPPGPFTLKPGQSQVIQAAVSIPSTQAPGSLAIPVRHSLNGGADGTGSNTLTLTIPTVRQVVLEPDGATSKGANSDNPALFTVLVRNNGNVQESVALSVSAPAGWEVTATPTSLTLPAGANANVTVSMTPPPGARDGAAATAVLRRDGGTATPVELTATVGAYFQVRLAVPVGTVLDAGRSGLVDATLHNEGNALDSILVKLGALPAGWRGGFLNGLGELQVEDVEPGSSRVVQISLMPPADAASDVPVQVTLSAASLGDASKTASKGILVTVVDANETTAPDTETGDGDNGIPGPGPVVLVALLALAAVGVRRKKA